MSPQSTRESHDVLLRAFYDDWRRRKAGISSPTSSPAVCRTEACGGSARAAACTTGSARTGAVVSTAPGCWRRRNAPVTVLNRLGRVDSGATCGAAGSPTCRGGSANRLVRNEPDAARGCEMPTACTLAVTEWTGVMEWPIGWGIGCGADIGAISIIDAVSGIASAAVTSWGAAWRSGWPCALM